jgi:hypothetical protein
VNFLQMADEVLARLGAASDDALLPVATRKGFVNAGQRAVDALLENPYWAMAHTTLATVAGDNNYAVPSDWRRTVSLRLITAGVPSASVLPFEAVMPFTQVGAGVGEPRSWTLEGRAIVLYPTPNAVYSYEHRYTNYAVDLSADGDTPDLPTWLHDAIVEKACALACRRIGQFERATVHQKEFDLLMQAVLLEQERGGRPPRMWPRKPEPK